MEAPALTDEEVNVISDVLRVFFNLVNIRNKSNFKLNFYFVITIRYGRKDDKTITCQFNGMSIRLSETFYAFNFQKTIGNEINLKKEDEEETSELLDLAKLVNILLNINTVTVIKKSQLVR